MPSVRTRRSTRVFVPKTVPKTGGRRSSSRALRSVKNEDWLRPSFLTDSSELPWLGGDGVCSGPDSPETCAHVAPEIDPPFQKMFGNVYYRKRRRGRSTPEPPTLADSDNRKYGIVFKRNKQRKKSKLDNELLQQGQSDFESEIQKFLEPEFTSPVVLMVLVKNSLRGCSDRFTRLLISMLSWLRTAGERFLDFTEFLQSSPLSAVFSAHGIDLLPVNHQKDNVLHTASSGRGICLIHGVWQSVPMLCVGFAALPFYFRDLHLVLGLRSFLSSSSSFRSPKHETDDSSSDGELTDEYESLEIGDSADVGRYGAKVDVYVNLSVEKSDSSSLVNSAVSFSEASFFSDIKSCKQILQRRMGKVVHFPNSSFLNSVEPIHVKPLSFRDSDFLSLREELNDASSALWSYHKHRKSSKKTPIERIKELKAALAEVKQNIDSITCHANILVVDTNCCWREERADVTLEQARSSDWCIAVKMQGSTRYTFKAQEMRPSVVNRYTHAYMWCVEDGWKLEFCDRWDWLVFKEMHTECRERNVRNVKEASPKIIPIPGVTEVPSYSNETDASFVRPHAYIRVTVDEVERAMSGDIAYYDMDSGDEEWLEHLNSNSFDESSHISEENFEKIIFAFEREIYDNDDELVSKERALDLCENLGKKDVVAAVYDYWLKKRNKKRAGGLPLVRVFQAPQSKRCQVIAKHFLRKKRSFKRQRSQVERSQVGRGKSEFLLQDLAIEETKQRLQEAETSAKNAIESAILLRSRAQVLMENADLAVYKSVMALKIAEALRVESPDLTSILD